MDYKVIKRYFWKGAKPKKTTLSLTNEMYDALESLAEVTGVTMPDIICGALDDFLVQMVVQGLIKAPKGVDITTHEASQKAPSATTSVK